MNVNPETATLGRKESVEPRKTPYDRLSSPNDLEAAISHLVELQNSWHSKRPVIMEVVNLVRRLLLSNIPLQNKLLQVVQSDGKSVEQGEKTSESAVIAPELRRCRCALHPGKNRWCYVMGPTSKYPGKHCPVGIDVVTLWARKIVRFHWGTSSQQHLIPICVA
jgi:hypothetical protein